MGLVHVLGNLNTQLLYYPSLPPIKIQHSNHSLKLARRDKYLYRGVNHSICPTTTDTVVEAGVSQGRDTAMFAKLADRVIGFEPSPRNYNLAKTNLRRFQNIELVNQGLWNKTDTMQIQYGNGQSDDGFLEPDSGTTQTGPMVPVTTLKAYVEENDIDTVDFLKVEAEGAEPEILEGIEGLDIPKIVVNAGEERNGNPTGFKVLEQLQSRGYELAAVKKGHILFFTNKPVTHSAFRR